MLIAPLNKTISLPVLPQQDILPNATDALPSLIESTTDTPIAPMNNGNYNNNH